MPIHLNLLAEAQAAEELRRRDPVKRAIFIAISLAAMFLVWSAAVGALQWGASATLANVEGSIAVRTNAYSSVMVAKQKLQAFRSRLDALDKFQSARFLQGNLLNALQQSTVDGVQLLRLRLDQTYSIPPETEKTDSPSSPPPAVKEKIILRLDARDFSANPGDQINKFITTISKQSYFKEMLQKTNAIELTGPPSAPQNDGGKTFVTFSLECRFQEQTR